MSEVAIIVIQEPEEEVMVLAERPTVQEFSSLAGRVTTLEQGGGSGGGLALTLSYLWDTNYAVLNASAYTPGATITEYRWYGPDSAELGGTQPYDQPTKLIPGSNLPASFGGGEYRVDVTDSAGRTASAKTFVSPVRTQSRWVTAVMTEDTLAVQLPDGESVVSAILRTQEAEVLMGPITNSGNTYTIRLSAVPAVPTTVRYEIQRDFGTYVPPDPAEDVPLVPVSATLTDGLLSLTAGDHSFSIAPKNYRAIAATGHESLYALTGELNEDGSLTIVFQDRAFEIFPQQAALIGAATPGEVTTRSTALTNGRIDLTAGNLTFQYAPLNYV